jgi:hypothetical protein
MASFGALRQEVYDRVSRSQYYRDNLQGLTAHERHQKLLNTALSYQNKGGQASGQQQQQQGPAIRTDKDILRERHRFLRSAEDDAEDSWEVRLAKRYYSRLFKEYAIADLSRHKEGQLGLRWRTEPEVVSGKGQFVCGARGCPEHAGLASYEVNFAYVEAGQHKQALVKVRLCPGCAAKLNYHKDKQYRKLAKRRLEEEEEQQERERRCLRRKQREAAAAAGGGAGRGVEQQQQQYDPGEQRHQHPHDPGQVDGCRPSSKATRPAAADDSHAAAPGPPSSSPGRPPRSASHGHTREEQQAPPAAAAAVGGAGPGPTRPLVTDEEIEQFLDEVFA